MRELLDESYDEDAEVYLGGFGFLPPNPKDMTIAKIKKYSNIFALAIIFTVLFGKILSNFIFNFVSNDISYTRAVIVNSLVAVVSFVFVVGLIYFLDRDFYKKIHFFDKINVSNLTTAVILTLSFWVFANVLAYILEDFFRMIGIINAPAFSPTVVTEQAFFVKSLKVFVMTILQEVFFRTLVLYRLREFGDKFAIFCTSLLFAIYSAEFLLGVKWFIVSIPLCYFALRYNNLLITVIVRLTCTYSLEFMEIVFGSCGSEVGNVLVVILGVTSLLLGLLTYFKLDFSFLVSNDNLTNKDKVINFVSTTSFVLMIVVAIFQAQGVLQFVG